jgi:large subunit ribosomal protein L24
MNRVHKGDLVEVVCGNDRGVRGEVQRVLPSADRVVVQGVRIVKKHQRRTPGVRTQTGIIEFEAPIHLSNVMPVCPACDKAVRVGYQVRPNGTKARVCRACDGLLD